MAMAMNVYMTLFRKYNAQQLKALEWKYHIMCYGTTFIVALAELLVETPARGKMNGPATVRRFANILGESHVLNAFTSSGAQSISIGWLSALPCVMLLHGNESLHYDLTILVLAY